MEWVESLSAWHIAVSAALATWTLLLALGSGGTKLMTFVADIVRGAAALSRLGQNSLLVDNLAKAAGMLERFSAVPDQLAELGARLDKLEHEFTFNSGSTAKDVLYDIRSKLYRNFDMLRATLTETDAGVFEANYRGEIVWANRVFLETVGMQLHQVLGNGWVQLIHPEDRQATYADWQNALDLRREFRRTFRMVPAWGGAIEVTVRTHIIHNTEKNFAGYIGFVHYRERT